MTGTELRDHRIALGLTQQVLADRIGLSRVMIGLERGLKDISERTCAAVLAAKPTPLDRRPGHYSPLIQRLERALIEARISYLTDHRIGMSTADFFLEELDIALYVASSRSDARRSITTEVDTLCVAGKSALNAFITLVQHGGVHARLNAKQDPYSVHR